ncbi:MAG: sugar phosphate isomerase/epimerase family protein [Limisphaerales bacterium]
MKSLSDLSRRTFISRTLTAAAAAGATWFDVPNILAAVSPARKKSIKKFGGFQMGIQSYCLRAFGVDGALAKIEGLGLHWVEFFRNHYPQTGDKQKISEMNAKLAKHDISISAHGVQTFTKDHKANENFFKFAKLAGVRNISANPQPDSFESLDKLVKKYDIRIAIHNHGPTHLYDKAKDVKKAVQKWDKRIGFCADLGHYIRSGEDPVEVVHLLGDRLYGMHLKDDVNIGQRRGKSVILGTAHLDVEGVFKALKKVKFPADGALSLEYEEKPEDPIEDIEKCLEIASAAAQKVARG